MNEAITRSGETWVISGQNNAEIAVNRPNEQVFIARFATMRDAACAVQGHNLLIEIAELYKEPMHPHERDIRVQMALKRYGR